MPRFSEAGRGGLPQGRRIIGVPSELRDRKRHIRLEVAAFWLWARHRPQGGPGKCLPDRASILRPLAHRRWSQQTSGSSAGPGGGLHNARHCPLLASCLRSRRPRPRLAGDLVLAPDWLLASTEVRDVSHTLVHVDLGAGARLKGPDTTAQPMGAG